MAKYRNWAAINKIKDPHLRRCLLLTHDDETLAIIERGKPELFSETPTLPRSVPLSALKRIGLEKGGTENAADYGCEKYGIPFLSLWAPGSEGYNDPEIGINLTEEEQKKFTLPMKVGDVVAYNDQEMVVVGVENPNATEFCNEYGKKGLQYFDLAPAECIDVKS